MVVVVMVVVAAIRVARDGALAGVEAAWKAPAARIASADGAAASVGVVAIRAPLAWAASLGHGLCIALGRGIVPLLGRTGRRER